MNPLRRRRFRISPMLLRRLTAGALLILYSWTALGVPLPVFSAAKRAGERFPCESCRCGCATAQQCWRSCCCHSLAERLAWAKRKGVQPPKFVLDEARRAGITEFDSTTVATNCCKAASKAACKPACCQSRPETVEAMALDSVAGWRALACQGQSLKWFAAPVTTVSVRIDMCDLLPPVAWLRPSFGNKVTDRSDEPTTPPPRWV